MYLKVNPHYNHIFTSHRISINSKKSPLKRTLHHLYMIFPAVNFRGMFPGFSSHVWADTNGVTGMLDTGPARCHPHLLASSKTSAGG